MAFTYVYDLVQVYLAVFNCYIRTYFLRVEPKPIILQSYTTSQDLDPFLKYKIKS